MKTYRLHPGRPQDGFALVMVFLFSVIGLMALAGALKWMMTNGVLIERTNQYYKTAAAAEAATEKVLTSMTRDYKNSGDATVFNSLATYSTLVPTPAENPIWNGYEFSNAQGTNGRTYVQRVAAQSYVPLASQYSGLKGFASTYRVISNARETGSRFTVSGAVQQDIQLASIPIFQFAIFYNGDMELNGAATMYVRGRAHGNANLFTGSSSSQFFYEDVTVAGQIFNGSRYGWSTGGSVNYSGRHDTNVTSLTLPIGTNNTAAAIREVVQMPLAGESLSSAMGLQRYYNKAELVILVSNSAVSVRVKNPFDATSTSIPWQQCTNFVSTNKEFTDQREGKVIRTTEIDVGKYNTWAATNGVVNTTLGAGRPPNLIYVADFRTESGSRLDGVRLVNGQTLPSRGLTVATPNPLYTKGHYNQPTVGHLGQTNTANTKPASLISDAYTLLSSAFNDSISSGNYANRDALDTTVVAAVIAGNVPSGATYSGGVNNLPRLLEDWTGKSYTLNGSLVCLYNSAKATAPFQSPGVYYSAPTRNINFDYNFTDVNKLPPGTPELRALVRSKWFTPPANTTTYAGP